MVESMTLTGSACDLNSHQGDTHKKYSGCSSISRGDKLVNGTENDKGSSVFHYVIMIFFIKKY